MDQLTNENGPLVKLLERSKLSTAAGECLISAYTATRQGNLEAAAHHYDVFERTQSQCLTLSEEKVDQTPAAQTLINGLFMFADVLQSLGRNGEAERKRKRAIEISQKYLGVLGNAEAERSRAVSLISEARFNEALVALYAARSFYQDSGNVLQMARISIDLADLLQWLGDYARAMEAIEYAASTYEQADLSDGLQGVVDFVGKERIATEIRYYRGLLAKYTGDYDKAEENFSEVLPKYKALGVEAAILYQIASVKILKGQAKQGLGIAEKIEPCLRGPGMMRPKLAGLLLIQAEGLMGVGQPDEAISRLEEGLRDLDSYYDPDLRWRLEWKHASALREAHRTGESVKAYWHAVETVSMLRKAPLGHRLDSLYLLDKMKLFGEAIALAADRGMAQDCARFIEGVKSRTLSAVLSIPRGKVDGNVGELEKKCRTVSERLDAIEFQAFRKSWSSQLRQERQELLDERAALLDQIRFSDPRWRTLSQPVELDMESLLSGLRSRNQAVIDLFITDHRVYSVLLGPDIESTASLVLSDDLFSALQDYRQNLAESEPNPLLFDASERLSILADSIIPDDLLQHAVAYDSLVVVPHGELHLLPWAGLEYRGKRLFEYCAVSVLPNLTSLLCLADDPSENPAVALLGPPDYPMNQVLSPLKQAKQEIEEISDLYVSRGGLLAPPVLAGEATEANFWCLAEAARGRRGVLHVTCHGSTEPAEPMNSGLYMRDGKVDSAEISQSKLPYSEIVLSACSTGWRPTMVRGVKLAGDDILGLPGAFIEAGAQSVLVSIPKAEERASKEFMVLYHKHRSSGRPPIQAYRSAQLEMLAKDEYLPAMWIGFVMYGCR